jgi:hypothetical protein
MTNFFRTRNSAIGILLFIAGMIIASIALG